jgi:hypothetical protein
MSLNRFGNKTLTGEDDLEVDKINITGQGIGFNDNFGSNGQIIKKSSIDNTIEWGDEQTFTGTLPIKIVGSVVSFDNSTASTHKVSISGSTDKTLHVGTTISLQENSGLILGSILDTSEINLLNSGVIDIFTDLGTTRKLTISKDSIIPTDSNTTYIIGSSANPINQITSNIYHTKTTGFFGDLTGDFLTISGTSISGNVNAHITGFKSFTLQSGDDTDPTQLISSNGNTITTHGGLLKTFGGNLDMERVIGINTTRGEIRNFSLIRGNTYALPSQNTIDYIGEARMRRIYTDDLVLYAYDNNGITGSPIIQISGTNNNINGNGATTITGISSATISSIGATTVNISGILTATDTAIFSSGIKQAIGGGNFSITANGTLEVAGGIFTGDIDMDDNIIENVILRDPTIEGNLDLDDNDIENVGGISMSGNLDLDGNDIENVKAISLSGGTYSGIDMNQSDLINVKAIGIHSSGTGINMNDKAITNVGGISMTTNTGDIDMNNSDIVACNTITCSSLNLSGEISNSNIPSTITGNKTFSGNTTFSSGMGANIDMNQYDLTNTGNITTTTGKITSSGDIEANGNIVGDGNTEITGCKFIDFTNWYIPADCYIGTSSRTDMTQQHLVKYILPCNFMPDDDNSDNRYTISDVNSGAGRNMGTSTQLYAQFTIPAGYKWVGYTVWVTNSSRIVYTGSGVLSFHSLPMIRTNFFQNQFVNTPFNTTNFSSSPITYGFTNGTFHYLTNQPSSGWSNSFNTNSATGVTTAQIMILRSSGFTNAYYIQGAEAYFFKDT